MITQAACIVSIPNVDKPQIIPLHRHGDIGKIFSAFGFAPGECKIVEQGFIDNHGKFYNRKEASDYVIKRHQNIVRFPPADELYSEDLY